MIHTAKQLKDKVKNMSGGNSEVAQALIRTYFMERFLERVSVSEYRNNFILKGGMLVASIVGVDMRATMDIDTTVKALPLNEKDARAIIERIGELQLEDGVTFKITSVKEIMEEFDYSGVRMMIEANLERMRQPMVGPILEEIAEERSDIKVGKINVDEQPELAGQFQVMSIPTLLVIKEGKIVNQSVGAMQKEAILAML